MPADDARPSAGVFVSSLWRTDGSGRTVDMTLADAALPPSFHLAPDRRSFRLDPRDPTFFADPYPVYAALHAAAPALFWEEANCLAVADHGLVSEILKRRDFGRVLSEDGSGRPARSVIPEHLAAFYALEAHSLLDLEAPAHTRLRSLLTRAFVSRRIEALAPRITQIATELLDALSPGEPFELVARFAEPLPVRVIAELIGVPGEAASDFLRWSHAMVAMYQFGRTAETEAKAEAAAVEFSAYLLDVIDRKRRSPADDLLSGLLSAETPDGRLRDEEVVSLVVLLLNAGHEATVHQIGNGLVALLGAGLQPSALRRDEIDPERTVEEMLRFDTPLHLFRRTAFADVEIAGHRIARGQEVALLLAAANRDPTTFADPNRFDPNRTRNPHVSFGAGIHFCIGAPLARLELRIALARLGERFGRIELAGPARFRDSFHFRGLERLDLRCEPIRMR